MTKLLQVITEYCAPYVDDVRLNDKAIDNPPSYAWTMWQYLQPQMARFTIPVEMPQYLYGTKDEPRFVAPKFGTYRYVAEQELTSDTVIPLGADFAGFELFSAHRIVTDKLGNVYAVPSAVASYDEMTGNITLTATAENPIAVGTVLDFDFYTDGSFVADLSPEIMTILGMCFECGWVTRFENDWLSNVPKIESDSFKQQNIANRMGKGTERLQEVERKLAGEMRKFEKNCYYRQTIPSGNRLKI